MVAFVAAAVAAIATALEGVTVGGLIAAAQVAIVSLFAADAFIDWLDTNAGAAMVAEQLNNRLAAAGVELEFPPFNPLFESGREVFKKTVEAYALGRLNAKVGTSFAAIEDLTPDNFFIEISSVLASQINTQTGANLTALWPIEDLKNQLHTEAIRQFDNRGRYAAGALFASSTMGKIKEKIAAKHPNLMAAVPVQVSGGMWGPPKNEKHAERRAKGAIRQEKYRRTHQQIWAPK